MGLARQVVGPPSSISRRCRHGAYSFMGTHSACRHALNFAVNAAGPALYRPLLHGSHVKGPSKVASATWITSNDVILGHTARCSTCGLLRAQLWHRQSGWVVIATITLAGLCAASAGITHDQQPFVKYRDRHRQSSKDRWSCLPYLCTFQLSNSSSDSFPARLSTV